MSTCQWFIRLPLPAPLTKDSATHYSTVCGAPATHALWLKRGFHPVCAGCLPAAQAEAQERGDDYEVVELHDAPPRALEAVHEAIDPDTVLRILDEKLGMKSVRVLPLEAQGG